jgi:hypothetical protein
MDGSRIRAVIQVLQLALKTFPNDENTYFNLIFFGTATRYLFPKSALANEENLKNASGVIEKVSQYLLHRLSSSHALTQSPTLHTHLFTLLSLSLSSFLLD